MLLFALLACDKTPPSETDPGPDCVDVDYATHAAPFVEVCTGCHSSALVGPDRQGAPDPLNFDPPGGVEGFANQMVALGTGVDPAMPPDGMPDGLRDDFALWVECGLPGLEPRCAGKTWEGSLTVSQVAPGFCDENRWVTGDLVVDAPEAAVACVCGVGGDLVVETESVRLPELGRIDGQFSLVDSAVVAVELSEIRQIGGGLTVERNAALTTVDLGSLMASGRVNIRDNPVLTALSLGSLESVDGALSVRDNLELAGLDLGALDQVAGPVEVRGNLGLTGLVTPDGLQSLPEALELVADPQLAVLEGFSGLESVAGLVRIEGLSPERITAFAEVREAGGVQLVDLGATDELHVFGALETVTGTVRAAHIGPVGDLDAFGELRSVGGGLVVDDFGGLAVVGFPALEQVGGGLEIAYNSSLIELRLSTLDSVGGLLVHHDPLLPSLDTLQGLTNVGGPVEIHHLLALSSLTGLDNVSVIDGGLRLEDLPALTDLTALGSLTEVRGDLLVRNVGGFDLSTLEALFASVDVQGDVTIE